MVAEMSGQQNTTVNIQTICNPSNVELLEPGMSDSTPATVGDLVGNICNDSELIVLDD